MGSSDKNSEYRNIILISQVGICVMIPMFLCMALGIWLDKKFGTYFTLPLLVVGIAAGARNAYVLVMNVVKSEENRRKKRQEDEIKRKIERTNQEKENDKQT